MLSQHIYFIGWLDGGGFASRVRFSIPLFFPGTLNQIHICPRLTQKTNKDKLSILSQFAFMHKSIVSFFLARRGEGWACVPFSTSWLYFKKYFNIQTYHCIFCSLSLWAEGGLGFEEASIHSSLAAHHNLVFAQEHV